MEQFLDYIIFIGVIATIFAIAIAGIYGVYRLINYFTSNKLEEYINSLHCNIPDFDDYEK